MSFTEKTEKPKEACGLFGVFAPGEDVARLTYFGLFSLQHRGQESAGIAVDTGSDLINYADMGLVTQVISEKILSLLKGRISAGHVRYSTTGSSVEANAQPILRRGHGKVIALAHNGNLVNALELREKLEHDGAVFKGSTDSEIMAEMLVRDPEPDVICSIENMMRRVRGAYSMLVLTRDALIAVRDPKGIRPLCLGRLDEGKYVFASETCALHTVGAKFIREILPGEIAIVTRDGIESRKTSPETHAATCVFEFIYFARPDSYINGRLIYKVRKKFGERLAREHPVDADIVISVPDSGTPAAIGYAMESGIPFVEGLIKNRYIGRTFINPDQRIRDLGIKIKLHPMRELIEGQRVVLVDDSIVRGTTSGKIVKMLFDHGAREVHMRISSPPVKFPCYYGIDTADRLELIANSLEVEQICGFLGATTLGYLSIEGVTEGVGGNGGEYCMACFNDKYPIPLPTQLELSKFSLET